MPITATSARSLLDALRYLWRGTRWRAGQERLIPAEVAGYLVDADGTQRSIGEFGSDLGTSVRQADLDDAELLVLTEFFGLNGFPAGLSTGRDALVGMVAMPSSLKAAGRSIVAKLLDQSVEKVAVTLTPRPFPRDVVLHPEPDPATRNWVLTPPVLGRRLQAAELATLLEAALYAAFDLIEGSEMFEAINAALHQWGQITSASISQPDLFPSCAPSIAAQPTPSSLSRSGRSSTANRSSARPLRSSPSSAGLACRGSRPEDGWPYTRSTDRWSQAPPRFVWVQTPTFGA